MATPSEEQLLTVVDTFRAQVAALRAEGFEGEALLTEAVALGLLTPMACPFHTGDDCRTCGGEELVFKLPEAIEA